jgi:hypothetical protein
VKLPWTINKHLILNKNDGHEGKINLFQGWVPVGGSWAQRKGNEGVHGGCILYLDTKIEE